MNTNAEVIERIEIGLDEIMRLLPHRPPFLFVEKLIEVLPGESAIGIKTVSINDDYFRGHFPVKPIMPGVLIVEALAQTSAALVMHSLGQNLDPDGRTVVYFMSIESSRFRRPVYPGDVLHLHVDRIHRRDKVWKFQGTAQVDGRVVADARYTAMITDV